MRNSLIQTAFENRFLRSREEVHSFDNSLGKYMEENGKQPKAEDLPDLFRIFWDDTEQHEVMFGLVHLIEEVPVRVWLPVYLRELPHLEEQGARDWARRIMGRLLLDERESLPLLADAIKSQPEPIRKIARQVLSDLAAKTKRPSAAPANTVLQRVV